jgi:hypothetical protein
VGEYEVGELGYLVIWLFGYLVIWLFGYLVTWLTEMCMRGEAQKRTGISSGQVLRI